MLMLRAVVLFLLLSIPLAAARAAGPQPPCEAAPVPSFGAIDGLAAAGAWKDSDLKRDGWRPPACLGWQGDSRLVAALASRFHSPASLDELAERLTAVSRQPGIRFWAVTRQEWRPLVLDAWALDGPTGNVRRADPTAAALVPGRDFYYAEQPEVGGRTVYRLRVLVHTSDSLVLATENVTPIRVAIMTLFQPGALQVVSFLHHEGPALWDLYEITRATEASSSFVTGYQGAYLNRLEAMHRFLADVPTDRDPPIAPR
jgi:hypothetical protein